MIGIVGWTVIVGAMIGWEAKCSASREEKPTFEELLKSLANSRRGRVFLLIGWLFVGWHFFGRYTLPVFDHLRGAGLLRHAVTHGG